MNQDALFNRRAFLRGSASAAAIIGAGALLVACGVDPTGPSATQVSEDALARLLPTYVPYPKIAEPDLPGNDMGLVDAYFTYPANPKKVTTGVPGDGSEVTAAVLTTYPIVPGVDSNAYWQELNKRLGVNFKITQTPNADYPAKFQTMLAGNDMPDLTQIRSIPPRLPQVLEAKFTDLSPYLSGDKVKKYPFLANIPSYYWSSSVVYNGGLYGVPIPAYKLCDYQFVREDIAASAGVDTSKIATWDDFVDFCEAVNDPSSNRWAIGTVVQETQSSSTLGVLGFANTSLGLPNIWSEKGGKFTSYWEDERFKDALELVQKLIKAGYVHPDALTGATADFLRNFATGHAVVTYMGLTSLPNFAAQNTIGDAFKVGGMAPVSVEGSKPGAWQRPPSFSFTAIKKTDDKARVEMLLELVNWMAAPFGSEEYRFISYGVEGVDFTVDGGGQPQQTPTGRAETSGFGVQYIGATPRVLYTPGIADMVQAQYELEATLMPGSVGDPTLGLYSETYASKWSSLATSMLDTVKSILKGDQPVSSFDGAVSTWLSNGGKAMKDEFATSLAARG